MTAKIFQLPYQTVFTGTGVPIAGSKVFFYQAGTLTPQNAYTESDLATAHANPVVADAAGRLPPIYLDGALSYRVIVRDSTDSLIFDEDDYSDVLTASEIGQLLFPRTAAEISESITPTFYEYPAGNVKRYGALGDDANDDTAAIQAAIDVVYAAGGGEVFIPRGIYRVTSIAKEWASAITVNIRGEGKFASVLKKTGATTTPVLNLTATTPLVETYSSLSDFRIIGNAKGHDGISLTLWARFDIQRVRVDTCDVALNSIGSLVFTGHDLTLQSNNTGYKCRLSGAIRANLVEFFGGQISNNTSHGMDIGDASGVNLYGVDLSANGTSADTSTGAIFVRNTVDDEAGIAAFAMYSCWLESNDGMTIDIDDSNLVATLHGVQFFSSESGNVMDVGDIRSLTLESVFAASVGDTIITAAKNTIVIGGQIATFTDNSTASSTYVGAAFGTGTQELTTQQFRLVDGTTTPATLSGFATQYVDTADGNLKIKFGDGEIRTICSDSALETYTPTNVTTDRAFDADTVAVAELADVVGTLIADLKIRGIIA